jgi:hypothetical protein
MIKGTLKNVIKHLEKKMSKKKLLILLKQLSNFAEIVAVKGKDDKSYLIMESIKTFDSWPSD